MDKLLLKIKHLFIFTITLIVSLFDRFMSYMRKRQIRNLESEAILKHPKLPKTEAVFHEYMLSDDVQSTDDIAAFFSTGVGHELVKKTNKDIKPPALQNSRLPIKKRK